MALSSRAFWHLSPIERECSVSHTSRFNSASPMPPALQKNAPSKSGRSRRRVNAAKRLDWMLREARCMAKPGAERETLERLVQQEAGRMGALGESAETVAEFQAAAAAQIALCDSGPVD